MKEKLVGILNKHCPNNVYLQGTMNAAEAYPTEFITFFTSFTEDISHYDNSVHSVGWNFAVIYYSDDPQQVNTKPFAIAADLKAAGFVQQGRGFDILSDEPTHTGWAMDFTYTEKL